MRETMVHYLPNEETLKHWAASGDVAQVRSAIEAVRAAGPSTELHEKLAVLDACLGVLKVFADARGALTALDSGRPKAITEKVDVYALSNEEIAGQSHIYGHKISIYIDDLRQGVGRIFPPVDEEPSGLLRIYTGLQDEESRQHVLKRLQTLSDVPMDWLKDRSRGTVLSVTDRLWEVAATGRDTAAFLQMPESDDTARADYIADWKTAADYGIEGSGGDLDQAIEWLQANKS